MPQYRSRTSTAGRNMAGARALWRATGMKDDDFSKPIIAIANSFTQFVPGHVHLKDLGQLVAREIDRRSIYGLLARPLRRWEFILGKYLGLLMTLAGVHLAWQVFTLEIDDPANCLRRFRANRDLGLLVLAAILLDWQRVGKQAAFLALFGLASLVAYWLHAMRSPAPLFSPQLFSVARFTVTPPKSTGSKCAKGVSLPVRPGSHTTSRSVVIFSSASNL